MASATMRGAMRESAATAVERIPWWPLFGFLALAAVSSLLGPEVLFGALVGFTAVTSVVTRPQLGVAIILFMLMVQYGARGTERQGVGGGLSSLVPTGVGLLSVNNVLGLFLAGLLVRRLSASRNWLFLNTPTIRVLLAVTAVLVVSAFTSGISVADQQAVGVVSTTAEDPSRMLASRALFVVLFAFFMEEPRDLLLIVGLFVVLSVITAWSGSMAGLSNEGRSQTATWRAGGTAVLIESTQNPNRLGMIATLALVYIWEYSEGLRSRLFRLISLGVVLMLVVTVFLTASRGGLIGLVFAGMMIFVRRSGGSGRWLYGFVAIAVAAVLVTEIVPPEALDRITNIPGVSSQSDVNSVGRGSIERREYTYGIGLQIWEKAPFIGVGPGNWSYVRFLTDPVRSVAAAHSSYLQALAEGGVIGLILFLLMFYYTMRDIVHCERDPAIMKRAAREGLDWVLVATRINLAAFLVFSLFSDLWDLIFSYFIIAIAAVLIQRYKLAPALEPA
jgi:O-antigen ligase